MDFPNTLWGFNKKLDRVVLNEKVQYRVAVTSNACSKISDIFSLLYGVIFSILEDSNYNLQFDLWKHTHGLNLI